MSDIKIKTINEPSVLECLEHIELICSEAKRAILEDKPIIIAIITDNPENENQWLRHDLGRHTNVAMCNSLCELLVTQYIDGGEIKDA